VLRVAFVTEPVIVTRPVRFLIDRLALPVRGRNHGIDLGVGDWLALGSTGSLVVADSASRASRRSCSDSMTLVSGARPRSGFPDSGAGLWAGR
jgi:hypothetical protein